MSGTARESAGLSRGALLIIGFEFCERFAFYGLLSLLALFLTAAVSHGGLGWAEPRALGIVGIYTGLMYAMPVLGGLAADRLLGHRRAIVVGAVAMIGGYLLLASFAAAIYPASASRSNILLWASLACLVLGNALVKATLVVVLSDTLEPGETRRDRVYGLYYMGINFGGLIAGIAAGSTASAFGWATAFLISGVAMLGALAAFVLLGRWLPRSREQRSVDEPANASATDRPAARLAVLAILAALLCVYSIGSFQLTGAQSVVLEHNIDRHVGTFEIPTPWFTSINSAGLIIAAPGLAVIWGALARRGVVLDIVHRYALALALGAVSLGLFAIAARGGADGAKLGWLLPALAAVTMATGEVVAWTTTYGAIYRLAPPSIVAGVVGAYYAATLGLGGYLAGAVGGFAQTLGYGRYFELLATGTALTAAVAIAARKFIRGLALHAGAAIDG